MDEPQNGMPNPDSLRVQFVELHTRSRWYSTQLWHVPFALFGVTGIVVAQVAARAVHLLPAVFFSAAILGAFVLWHMAGLMDGEKRAVENLQNTERLLALPPTAKYKPANYVVPLMLSVVVAEVAFLSFGSFLVACLGCGCLVVGK